MSQPPPPSPEFDWEPDDDKQKTQVAVGIAVGVLILFSAPFVWLWLSEKRRRRHRAGGEEADIGGTTAVTDDWMRREHALWFGDTTLAVSMPARSIDEKDDSGGEETGETRSAPPKPVTEEQILGTDKASYLGRLPLLEGMLA